MRWLMNYSCTAGYHRLTPSAGANYDSTGTTTSLLKLKPQFEEEENITSVMASDEGDFDELAAMLDDDAIPGPLESSDDDIDEDELDRLAYLAEENQNEKGNSQVKQTVPKPASDSNPVELAASSKQPEASGKSRPGSNRHDSTDINTESNKPRNSRQAVSPEEMQDQMKIMQDKIKMLEQQLLQQNSQSSQGGSPVCNRELQMSASQNSNNNNSQEQAKSSLKEIDLFGQMSDDEEDQNQKSNGSAPKHAGKSAFIKFADSDSDWEDMEGEKPKYSSQGEEIRKLLKKGTRKRVAHETKPKAEDKEQSKSFAKRKPTSAVPSLSVLPSASPVDLPKLPKSSASKDEENGVVKDPFSGIRIINPLVSTARMKMRMEGRNMVKMSRISSRMKNSDMGDWVTIGVVVSKTEPKISAKGSTYSIWKLSDLDNCDKVINFFLFGDVHKQHWKTSLGTVIGILNPSIMPNAEKQKDSSEISLTADHPQKIMGMGQSKDYGTCRATTKAGKPCNNFVNLQMGEYCTFHVQAAYKRQASKRTELSASYAAPVPKAFEQKLFAKKDSGFMYGGKYYTTGSAPVRKNNQANVTVKNIQQYHVQNLGGGAKSKISTATLHELLPEDKAKFTQLKTQQPDEKKQAFLGMLSTPSSGSMNLVRHIADKEKHAKKAASKQPGKPIQSISAAELLKTHKQEMSKLRQKQPQPPPVPTASPQLGRGFAPGGDIFLDTSPPSFSRSPGASAAKAKALAKIQAKGGIEKTDPNAVRKRKVDSDKIRKRVSENQENSEEGSIKNNVQEPPKKRSRLLGDLDLDDPEVQKLLKSRSSHESQLTQEEQERQDQYFEVLEKKEQMEEKMSSITKVKCKAVSCKQCKYTSFSAAQRCRDEGHRLITHDAVKRFFMCKDCKRRTISLDKLPKESCRGCGGSNYVPTSMLKEKKGPKLPGEDLQLRGEEIKFLNSLQ